MRRRTRSAARAAFALFHADARAELRASIERVASDADAVAQEVAASGLPREYAHKLVAAA